MVANKFWARVFVSLFVAKTFLGRLFLSVSDLWWILTSRCVDEVNASAADMMLMRNVSVHICILRLMLLAFFALCLSLGDTLLVLGSNAKICLVCEHFK